MIHNGVIIDDGEIRVFLDGLTEDYVSVHMNIVQYISLSYFKKIPNILCSTCF